MSFPPLKRALAWLGLACCPALAAVTWKTETAAFTVDDRGQLSSILRRADGREFLATNTAAPLLQVRVGGVFHQPSRAAWNLPERLLELRFEPAGVLARVVVQETGSHVRLELKSVEGLGPGTATLVVDVAAWGPFPTRLQGTVGEVVGVVRDAGFALGLQSLNPKTLGGYPENDEGNADRPYAAQRTGWGSTLGAYSMDRSRPRRIAVWNKRAPNMPVPALPGETVAGSAIALFGVPEADALATLGRIEVAEKLPHPLIDGVWAKVSPERGRSYLIAAFSEANVDEILQHVKRANLVSLYHSGPFRSWGHYQPSPKYFPSGLAGLKACAEKARALGIRLGAHTLSNFIQTDDPYVTPVPDPRLVRTGSSPLTGAVDATTTTLPVASPEYFTNRLGNELQTVMIESELVRYRSVSETAPWRLLDCQRGAFGTRPSAHPAGAEAGKLMDHAYKVFFPDLGLQREIARNLARVFNETGLSHMDFDGHEGCLAPGEGTYGNEVFAQEFQDHLDHPVLNGTSPPLSHYYWHFNSYCNWGEPWYGGFRDSMQEYRLNNQAFCERNYLPKMLGWYLLTPHTCLSDMEWMLARAAGHDAGFALATGPDALRRNPGTGAILDAIREWELARRSGAFSETQRERLRHPKAEFHLAAVGGGWDLYPFHDSPEFTHEQRTLQPGEPTGATWEWTNPDAPQPLQFKLRVQGQEGAVTRLRLEGDRAVTLELPGEVRAGQSLLLEADGVVRVYDAKGSHVRSEPLAAKVPLLRTGMNHLRFDGDFS
ncbi:MAG: hypothetical protein ACKOET_11635, partial [Verrucomicrobiota bacterium]